MIDDGAWAIAWALVAALGWAVVIAVLYVAGIV